MKKALEFAIRAYEKGLTHENHKLDFGVCILLNSYGYDKKIINNIRSLGHLFGSDIIEEFGFKQGEYFWLSGGEYIDRVKCRLEILKTIYRYEHEEI